MFDENIKNEPVLRDTFDSMVHADLNTDSATKGEASIVDIPRQSEGTGGLDTNGSHPAAIYDRHCEYKKGNSIPPPLG
jgi:hypothetical protein